MAKSKKQYIIKMKKDSYYGGNDKLGSLTYKPKAKAKVFTTKKEAQYWLGYTGGELEELQSKQTRMKNNLA
jgi:hypothetical protein